MKVKSVSALKVAHHLEHTAAMCELLANTLEALIDESNEVAGRSYDAAADAVESLRASAENSNIASDAIMDEAVE